MCQNVEWRGWSYTMVMTSFGVHAGLLRKWCLLKKCHFKHSHMQRYAPDGAESGCCYFFCQQLGGVKGPSWKTAC